jgi:hypothetical protein
MPAATQAPPGAITTRQPEPAAGLRPPVAAREGGAWVPETPWAKVGLVLGLILLAAVLIGLLGAWWVSAGMHAARGKRAARDGAGSIQRQAVFSPHPSGPSTRA